MTDPEVRETRSTCPYCGVGCGVIIESRGREITGVRGDPAHPANLGRLCSKGHALHLTAAAPVTRQARLTRPLRRARRGEALAPVSWDAALVEAAERFAGVIRAHGPGAVGFHLSGQLLTEDLHVFNKLARGLIGTNNIDTSARLGVGSAAAACRQVLGTDAPPACYADVDHAEVILIAGANTAWTHPVLFRRIEAARQANPRMKLVVVDPRRTETAAMADLHLPILPGTDVALFLGMLYVMLWDHLVDPRFIAAHTTGFDALRARVIAYHPKEVARLCGIDTASLMEAARWFASSRATLSLYGQGLSQNARGTDRNAALLNLHLATGQIGRPGAGPFPLTGQPNAMGAREVGAMADRLPGHRDPADPVHRDEVARLWGVPEVPAGPGLTAVEMFEAAARGEIKALWIAGSDPARSLPDQATVRRALARCEFVVVQEAFATTATCAHADLLLPATAWGEKDGTMTNSERCISRVRPAVAAPGEARHDWAVAVDFARQLEHRLPPRRADGASLFPYDSPEAIWNEHRQATRGRDLDVTGLSYAALEAAPRQWPCPEGQADGLARLHADGRFPTPDGRARFADVRDHPVAEPCDSRYPFSLITGRLREPWLGMSRTGTLGRQFGHVSEPCVQINPREMAHRGLQHGDLVHLTSRRGSILVPVEGSDQVPPGQAFLAMHWGEAALGGASSQGEPLAGVNALTMPACCPVSRQPELKHTAVKVLKAELPWTLLAAAWLPQDQALQVREALRSEMRGFAFATCVPFGHEPDERGVSGVLFRAAAYEAPPAAALARLEALLGLDGPAVLRHRDRRHGHHRAMRLAPRPGSAGGKDDLLLQAFLLGGDTRAQSWILPLLQDGLPAGRHRRLLLAPGARAPAEVQPRGRQVCTCLHVAEPAIIAALAGCHGSEDSRLQQLQARLRCGTNCGTCLPELRQLVRAHARAA